jgi:hypothetical protein
MDFMKTPALVVDERRASWPFRQWGIRHFRYLYCRWRVRMWAAHWGGVGIGLGVPNDSDMKVLDAIWRGER